MSLPHEQLILDGARFAERAYGRQLENADATIQFQRDVIARLQFQLSSAQAKLGMTPQAIADAGSTAAQAVASGDVAPWVLDPDVMTPLFAAYDTRIQELESSNKGLVDAVMTAKSRLEDVLRENDALRNDLAASVERAAALKETARQPYASSKSVTSGILDHQRIAELQEIADLSSKEAKALREEVSLLLKESQELRESCQERDEAIMAQMTQHKAVLQSLSQAQDAIRGLDRDRQIAEQEVQKLAARLSDTQREHAQCETMCSQLQADVSRKNDQIRDYRAAIEELSSQANTSSENLPSVLQQETEALLTKTRGAMIRCHELKAQLDESLAGNHALREQLRVSEVEFSATKSDAEGMLKVISQLEKQCAELQDAENCAKMAEDGAGASMQTLAVERDQAVAKEAQARRELARVLERRRVEIADAQAHEADAIAETRSRLLAQINSREAELSTLREQLTAAGVAVDRSVRDLRATQKDSSRVQISLKEEISRLRREMESVNSKMLQAMEARDSAQRQSREAMSNAAAAVEEANRDRQHLMDRALAAEAALHRASLSSSELEARNKSLQLCFDECERQRDTARDECEQLKHKLEYDYQRMVDRKDAEIRELASSASLRRLPLMDRADSQQDSMQGSSREAELIQAVQSLQHDLMVASAVREEMEMEAEHMRRTAASFEDTIEELHRQLRQYAQREDERIRELAEARTQLEVTKLALTRSNVRGDSLQVRVDELESKHLLLKTREAAAVQPGQHHAGMRPRSPKALLRDFQQITEVSSGSLNDTTDVDAMLLRMSVTPMSPEAARYDSVLRARSRPLAESAKNLDPVASGTQQRSNTRVQHAMEAPQPIGDAARRAKAQASREVPVQETFETIYPDEAKKLSDKLQRVQQKEAQQIEVPSAQAASSFHTAFSAAVPAMQPATPIPFPETAAHRPTQTQAAFVQVTAAIEPLHAIELRTVQEIPTIRFADEENIPPVLPSHQPPSTPPNAQEQTPSTAVAVIPVQFASHRAASTEVPTVQSFPPLSSSAMQITAAPVAVPPADIAAVVIVAQTRDSYESRISSLSPQSIPVEEEVEEAIPEEVHRADSSAMGHGIVETAPTEQPVHIDAQYVDSDLHPELEQSNSFAEESVASEGIVIQERQHPTGPVEQQPERTEDEYEADFEIEETSVGRPETPVAAPAAASAQFGDNFDVMDLQEDENDLSADAFSTSGTGEVFYF